ncbi:hypothetical protein V6N12_047205 [Hibiscus sabdariffa]|uniref:Uncharacterized protein n=1 Tax=Hibiscus sabdariffa TaxID=183260 RepID=A0ABR2DA56_9ROSI
MSRLGNKRSDISRFRRGIQLVFQSNWGIEIQPIVIPEVSELAVSYVSTKTITKSWPNQSQSPPKSRTIPIMKRMRQGMGVGPRVCRALWLSSLNRLGSGSAWDGSGSDGRVRLGWT